MSGRRLKWWALLIVAFIAVACKSVDNQRIPAMPVNISLADAGMWNTYGVSGFGINRSFILTKGLRLPAGFPYSEASATGFGGVLLVGGIDPFSATTEVPLAYDLACPVERDPSIRVEMDNSTYVAVCPECKSTYDVTMGAGAPLSGIAATGKYKYGLKKYSCMPSGKGGYVILN